MHQMKLLLFFLNAYMRMRTNAAAAAMSLQRCRLCDSVFVAVPDDDDDERRRLFTCV